MLQSEGAKRECRMADASTEVKPGFSWRYVLLTTLIALIPSGIGGVAGYYFNEYTRDKKVIEVSTTASGNLAATPVSIAGNLQILLPIGQGKTEQVKSLVRYDIRVSNKTEQGIDDFQIFVRPPSNITLVSSPTITTIPQALQAALSVRESTSPLGYPEILINLLNPGQSVKLGFLGYSQTDTITGTVPLDVVVSKKDWRQVNVVEETNASKGGLFESHFFLLVIVAMNACFVASAISEWIFSRLTRRVKD